RQADVPRPAPRPLERLCAQLCGECRRAARGGIPVGRHGYTVTQRGDEREAARRCWRDERYSTTCTTSAIAPASGSPAELTRTPTHPSRHCSSSSSDAPRLRTTNP